MHAANEYIGFIRLSISTVNCTYILFIMAHVTHSAGANHTRLSSVYTNHCSALAGLMLSHGEPLTLCGFSFYFVLFSPFLLF